MEFYFEGSQVLGRGEEKVLLEGEDPESLLFSFCDTYVLPGAHRGFDTKKIIRTSFITRDWNTLITCYLRNEADLW